MSEDLENTADEFHQFIAHFKSVMLATTDAEGNPECSYAPFIRYENNFYIFVSELAIHTRNLLLNKKACLLFIEDEDKTKNVFARRRATIGVSATESDPASSAARSILDQMEKELGNTMQLLRGLSDFHLLALKPLEASYTAGFGKAYRLTGNGLSQIEHLSRR